MYSTSAYRRLLGTATPFRSVFAGQVISRLGDAVDDLAVLWLVLSLTGSALATATALIIQIVPTLLFGLAAGALADRWDRRRTLVAMDVVRAVLVASIPILRGLGLLSLGVLYGLVFALAVASQIFRPALRASLPNLVSATDLVGANSLLETTRQLGGIVGPGLAGALIAWVGLDAVFALDAVSYLVSGVLIRRATFAPQRRGEAGNLAREMAEGIRYLLRERTVRSFALLGILSHLYWAAMPLVAPVFAQRVLGSGPAGYGALLSGLNVGMVASGLLLGLLPGRVRRGRLIVAGYAGMGLSAALLSLTHTLWPAVAAFALSGAVAMLTVVPFFALLQERVPDQYRGRVFATDETLEHAVLPLFYALSGWLLDARGASFALLVVGAALMGVALLGIAQRPVRDAI